MELNAIYRSVVGIDVHQAKLTACALYENEAGEVVSEIKEFGGFKRDRVAMSEWVASFRPECVVMESTGIYWKSPYAALEKRGLKIAVVNARHIKQVPGRKTDIADAQWLATLARSGLLRASFVPKVQFRELRLISRYIQRLTRVLAGQKNRLHKLLSDAGIRLSVVVSDLNGKAAQAMIAGLLDGETPEQLLRHTGRLKASKEDIEEALAGDLSLSHHFVIAEIMATIDHLEASIEKCRQQLRQGLAEYQPILLNLQTIPGIDETAAATLLVEIGDDMDVFGSPERLASWAGVCPGNHESAGKRQSGKTRKGNYYLRRVLCEVANAISRTRCSLCEKFKGLVARRGRKRAIFAIAHKVLKIAFLLIKKGECYRPPNQDYEALAVKRNAPRWIKLLKKQGFVVKKAEQPVPI